MYIGEIPAEISPIIVFVAKDTESSIDRPQIKQPKCQKGRKRTLMASLQVLNNCSMEAITLQDENRGKTIFVLYYSKVSTSNIVLIEESDD